MTFTCQKNTVYQVSGDIDLRKTTWYYLPGGFLISVGYNSKSWLYLISPNLAHLLVRLEKIVQGTGSF